MPLRLNGLRYSLAEIMTLVVLVAVVCRWPPLIGLGGAVVACWIAGRFREIAARSGRPGWLYCCVLPVLWFVAALASWRHPGDEYGMFIVSALPASWILPLVSEMNLQRFLPVVFLAGAVMITLCGWALDRLRVWPLLWLPLYVATAAAMVLMALRGYPSYERAMMKNGSLTAYVSSAANASLYLTTIFCYLLALAIRVVQAVRVRAAATT